MNDVKIGKVLGVQNSVASGDGEILKKRMQKIFMSIMEKKGTFGNWSAMIEIFFYKN